MTKSRETRAEGAPGWVADEFARLEARADAFTPSRRRAYELFSASGFPTPADESWKYTNLAPVISGSYTIAGLPEQHGVAESLGLDLGGTRFFFVNGRVVPKLCSKKLPEGMELASIDDVLAGRASEALAAAANKHLGAHARIDGDAIASLNTSFFRGGAVLLVKKGAVIEKPISLTFVTAPDKKPDGAASVSAFPRLLLIAEEQSEVTLVERHVGTGPLRYLSAAVTEISAAPASNVDHYKIIEDAGQAAHLGSVAIDAARAAHARTHTITFGGALVRNQLSVSLRGEGSYALLNGLTVLSDSQHVDNNTIIDHIEPHCESHELYKGIYGNESQGVFSGTIIVQPGAQKTNAYQSNQSILLTPDASVNSRPQLKIWADDVKCTHGATVGQLDDDALFYIRSRGVGAEDARNMLIRAFAGEVISGVTSPLQEHLERRLLEKLSKR